MRFAPLAAVAVAAALFAPARAAAADSVVVQNAVNDVFVVSVYNVDDPFGVNGIPCGELTIGTGQSATFGRSGLCGAYQKLSIRVLTFRFEGSGPPRCEYRGLEWGQAVSITGGSAAISCVRTN